MRVLFVFNHGRIVGGGEIAFLNLIRVLSERGDIEAGVYIPSGEGDSVLGNLSGGIRRLRVFSFPLRGVRSMGFAKSLFGFVGMLKDFSPDIVHVNGSRALFYSGLAKKILFKKKTKVVWHVRIKIRDFYDPIFLLLCDFIIANSCRTALRFPGFIRARKVKIIYNGVDTSLAGRVEKLKKGEDIIIKKRLGIGVGQRVIASAGRLEDGKGFEEFLRAAHIISKKHKKLRFLVAGSGQLREKLLLMAKRFFRDEVVMPGFMRVEEIFAVSDVFVFPSFVDSFGNIVLESMVCGVPPVVSRFSGVSEILSDGVDALLVNPSAPSDIARAIDELLDDEKKYVMISENARKKALEFSVEKHAKEVFNFYASIIG